MTEADARAAITTAFVAAWPTASAAVQGGGVPFSVDNETVVLPESGNFAYLSIMLTTSRQMTVGRAGTRRVQRNGWVQVKLWTPAGERTDSMAKLCGVARSILEMTTFPPPAPGDDPVTTLASSSQPGDNDGRWQTNLTRCGFWFSETI